MKLNLPVGMLAKYIEEFNSANLEDNKDISVGHFGIRIPTLDNNALVNRFIKKFNLPMIELTFGNGYSIRVAKKHILQQDGKDIFACQLAAGDLVDHATGQIMVTRVSDTKEDNCYDISIDAPHLYLDTNGLIHHNTIMTAALSWSVEPYGRSVVIVPNKSLVTQTESDYKNLGLDVGVYFGDRKEFNKTHTICTWQSLNNLLKNTKEHQAEVPINDFIEGVVCIMVDEVHMAKADVLKTLLTSIFAHVPVRWGLTGTIPKEEYAYQAIYCGLGNSVGQLSAKTLQDAGHLAQCHVNIVQLVDHTEYTNYQSELKYLVETDARLDYLADLILKVKESGNTLILVDRVNTGKKLIDRLGDKAVFVSGATKVKDRKEEYDEVATADDKVIVATYGVAAVGINIPRIFNLILLEPGKSFTRVIQSIGRGIRKAEDKNFVQIWDVTSTCKFSKRHLTKRKQFYKEAHYPFAITKVEWQ